MAISTNGDLQEATRKKRRELKQMATRAVNVMDVLVSEVEQFSAYLFSEYGTTQDAEDLAIVIASFEVERAKLQVHMDRMNVISAIAPQGTTEPVMVSNAMTFIGGLNPAYNHAAYSVQFNIL